MYQLLYSARCGKDKLKFEDDIYRVVLQGNKNLDIDELSEAIYAMSENICEVRNETHLPYDLEQIATSKNLKGIFTRKMLEYLEQNPRSEEEVMKAIEITFNSL